MKSCDVCGEKANSDDCFLRKFKDDWIDEGGTLHVDTVVKRFCSESCMREAGVIS